MDDQSLAFLITLVIGVAFLFLFLCIIILCNKIANLIDKWFVKEEERGLEETFGVKEGGQKDEWNTNNFNNFL